MVSIRFSDGVNRTTKVVSEGITVAEYVAENSVPVSGKKLMLNGTTLAPEDFGRTFSDLGVTETGVLTLIVPKENA